MRSEDLRVLGQDAVGFLGFPAVRIVAVGKRNHPGNGIGGDQVAVRKVAAGLDEAVSIRRRAELARFIIQPRGDGRKAAAAREFMFHLLELIAIRVGTGDGGAVGIGQRGGAIRGVITIHHAIRLSADRISRLLSIPVGLGLGGQTAAKVIRAADG